MTVRIWTPALAEARAIEAPGDQHFCQIHQKESSLVDAVIRYLVAGIAAGENLVMITRPHRQELILEWLAAKNFDVPQLLEQRRIFLHSGRDLLDAVIRNDAVDEQAFMALAPRVVDEASWSGRKTVRIYGDAVSDLWQAGRHGVAVELEAAWNRMREKSSKRFSLFCGYLIEALDPRSYSEHLANRGREHAFVIPAAEDHPLRCALDEAVREVLGAPLAKLSANASVPPSDWRSRLPLAFRIGLWLYEFHPAVADRVFKRARELYVDAAKSA